MEGAGSSGDRPIGVGEEDGGADLWRAGPYLVLGPEDVLPDRCVRCNLPATGERIVHRFAWHDPIWYLLLLSGGLPYGLVELLVTRRAALALPVCGVHRARRRRLLLIA